MLIDYNRDPCPWRILEDIGGGFAIGYVGGGTWHMVKGYRSSPSGKRLYGAMSSARYRSPVLGGNFALWGAIFSSADCFISRLRRKEGPLNSMASGAFASSLLSAHRGMSACIQSGVIGGISLALIEGLILAVNRVSSRRHRPGVVSEDDKHI